MAVGSAEKTKLALCPSSSRALMWPWNERTRKILDERPWVKKGATGCIRAEGLVWGGMEGDGAQEEGAVGRRVVGVGDRKIVPPDSSNK